MENALREMYAFCLKELMITNTIGKIHASDTKETVRSTIRRA